MTVRIILLLFISTLFAFSSIANKSFATFKSTDVTAEREVAENFEDDHSFNIGFDFDNVVLSLRDWHCPLTLFFSKTSQQRYAYRKNVLVNTSVNHIYLAHAPPFLS